MTLSPAGVRVPGVHAGAGSSGDVRSGGEGAGGGLLLFLDAVAFVVVVVVVVAVSLLCCVRTGIVGGGVLFVIRFSIPYSSTLVPGIHLTLMSMATLVTVVTPHTTCVRESEKVLPSSSKSVEEDLGCMCYPTSTHVAWRSCTHISLRLPGTPSLSSLTTCMYPV